MIIHIQYFIKKYEANQRDTINDIENDCKLLVFYKMLKSLKIHSSSQHIQRLF